MVQCKITVIHRSYQQELIEAYTTLGPGHGLCPWFEEGQEFIVGLTRPEKFCTCAWKDLHKLVIAVLSGGDLSLLSGRQGPNAMLGCCTDGLRPVVFKVEPVIIRETA